MAPWAAVTAAALLIPRVCGTAARFEVAVMNGTMAPAGGGVVVLKRPPMVSVVASQIRGARALQNGGERDVIVTGGNEGTVCVWDAETTTDVYHVVDMWSGGTGRMWLAAVPSGYLITGDGGSQPGEAALFDLTPAQPARLHSWPLRAAVTAITAAVYETPLAATDVVAVGLESGAIEILIPSTEKAVSWERWGMDQHGVDTSRPIESLAARGTAFYLAQDETVFSYTSLIQTNGTKARLFKAGGAVSAMAVSPDGSTLVYAQGFTIRTMGLQADGLVATVGNVRYMGGIVTALAWVADTPDARLAVSDDSGTVILLNQTLHPISFDSADSSSVTLPAVANALASGSGDLLYGVCEDGSLFKFSTTPDATSDDSDSGNNTLAPPTPAPQTASPESQAGVLTEVFGGHITSESGQRAVIQVRLAAAPAGMAPTVLTFWTSHDGEGEAIPSTVTYTSASWSQSQNVTVQGVDDDIPDGDVEYEISIHVTDSGDQSYLDLEPTYLTFTNLDNDTLVSTTSQAAASTTSQTTVSSSQSSGAESPSATTTSAPPSPAPPTISPPTSAPPTSSPPSPAPPTISPALTTISPPTSTPSTSSLPSPTPLTISPPLPSPAPTQAAVGAAAAEETAVVPVGLWAAMAVVALVLGCGAVWWCWRRRGLREFEEPPALSDESELMLREDTASTLKDLKGRIDSATPYRTAEADPLPLTDSRVTLRETTQSLRMQQSYLGVPPLFSAYSSATAPPRRRDVLRDASRTSSDATTAEGGDLIYTPSYVDVLRPLGHGAYGAVYLAAHKVTMEQVAVKRMTMSAGAETELKMLRKLRHPRIVALKGFHVEGALGGVAEAYLYLEYVSGGSLYDLVQNSGGRLFEASVRRLMKDAVLGLHYLHAHGVVHRDIKPHNLLVDGNGRVKVADFGCCKDVDTGTASRVQGTPHYMAPEACHGRASAASDIWSVGACICELASGLPPWHEAGRSGMALMFYITSQGEKGVHPQIPETASPGAKEAIERCFARDAADRWTCDSLLQSPLFMDVGTPLPGQETLEGYNSTRDKPDNAASPFASPAASPRNAQGAPQGSPKSALWAASMSIPAETLATLEDL
eukprot:TRINITY_DN1479_c0_g1_i6.p1 TRINITY_DN1479_c0_g1~~TRINITY_DN1479_c0_g1_i6.p1  ORF type:complete len:1097 (+),score=229.22 TRINITY_DN1479_c0_g1_i6:57-3347(+)